MFGDAWFRQDRQNRLVRVEGAENSQLLLRIIVIL